MIDQWLKDFKDSWMAHDIDAVMELFTHDVDYWETPYQLVYRDWETEIIS